jgi:BirA family biotin operon repressor/biotin-[acetyl-CoA-carboxylase] ligase
MPVRQHPLPRHDAGPEAVTTPAAGRARGTDAVAVEAAARDAAPRAWAPMSNATWDIAGLQQILVGIEPALQVRLVAETGSTNTDLLELARADAPGPARPRLLVAEQQLQGRGRQGRAWQSARGASLTFSLALPLAPGDWSGLSLAVGVALAEALDPANPARPARIGLKWPNDLWLRDPGSAIGLGRKLGGILIETVACAGERVCVVGVGLNLRPQPVVQLASGFACLHELEPGLASAPMALARIAPALLRALRHFERDGLQPFAAAYAARDVLHGCLVRTTLAALPGGRAEGVDGSGALRVRDAQGGLHLVHAGDVSIRLDAGPAAREG